MVFNQYEWNWIWNFNRVQLGHVKILILVFVLFESICGMTVEEKTLLREDARDMFYHAYQAYMENAYPADELMPLSCKGRFRDTEPSRGDIDEALGNFSLTLVDTLDTLVVLGDLEEFEHALKLVVRDVTFDNDVVVSVFETNIRMIGGLLSGHILASYIQERFQKIAWYKGELLSMAKDLGYRLLPAFNTTTGIPHPRINLVSGLKTSSLSASRETCTACAGTIILEFAALSRLSGDPIFEEKAVIAMDALWSMRHRQSELMGTVLNIHSGDWVRRDSGVGAGIDSYYEYLLKGHILLGNEAYLSRFNTHYAAVMKYISQGPMLVDVHMHRPYTNSKNFMDALLAFWPGLQVLKGDIKPAIETHEMLYQVTQRHNFIPEAFTTDFKVHWGQHPLRPEFIESTYLLHRATGDPYYLEVGKDIVRALQKHARVPCGYAAVKDVRTGGHEDRMDSFVLAETFKYLYLLFAEPSDLLLDMDEFIFTTEAHLLPLTLARLSNYTSVPLPVGKREELDIEMENSCPNIHYLFRTNNTEFATSVRDKLKDLVNGVCPTKSPVGRKLIAQEFQAGNQEHLAIIRDMGISMMSLPDGRLQLLHTASNAKSVELAEEGASFMQEMIELTKTGPPLGEAENPPRIVYFVHENNGGKREVFTLDAGPAQFGPDFTEVGARVAKADPFRVCEDVQNSNTLRGKIALIERGDCMFVEKARRVEKAGAVGGIVIDNNPESNANNGALFAMSGDGKDDVTIPMVFLFAHDARLLLQVLEQDPNLHVILAETIKGKGLSWLIKTMWRLDGSCDATRYLHDIFLIRYLPTCMIAPISCTENELIDLHLCKNIVTEMQLLQSLVEAMLTYTGDAEEAGSPSVTEMKSPVKEYLNKKPTSEHSEGVPTAIRIKKLENGNIDAETLERDSGRKTLIKVVKKLSDSSSSIPVTPDSEQRTQEPTQRIKTKAELEAEIAANNESIRVIGDSIGLLRSTLTNLIKMTHSDHKLKMDLTVLSEGLKNLEIAVIQIKKLQQLVSDPVFLSDDYTKDTAVALQNVSKMLAETLKTMSDALKSETADGSTNQIQVQKGILFKAIAKIIVQGIAGILEFAFSTENLIPQSFSDSLPENWKTPTTNPRLLTKLQYYIADPAHFIKITEELGLEFLLYKKLVREALKKHADYSERWKKKSSSQRNTEKGSFTQLNTKNFPKDFDKWSLFGDALKDFEFFKRIEELLDSKDYNLASDLDKFISNPGVLDKFVKFLVKMAPLIKDVGPVEGNEDYLAVLKMGDGETLTVFWRLLVHNMAKSLTSTSIFRSYIKSIIDTFTKL